MLPDGDDPLVEGLYALAAGLANVKPGLSTSRVTRLANRIVGHGDAEHPAAGYRVGKCVDSCGLMPNYFAPRPRFEAVANQP